MKIGMSGSGSTGSVATVTPPRTDRPAHEYVYSTQFRLFLREGEEFRLWMNPLLYMRQDAPGTELNLTESERRRLLLSLVQERLRKLLYVFLHGHALPELACIMYVLGDRSRDRLAAELRALDFLGRELRDFPDIGFEESRLRLKDLLRNGRFSIPQVADALAVFHREMAPVFAQEGAAGIEHQVPEVPAFDAGDYRADAAMHAPLATLAADLREGEGLLRSAYLLGSLATQDYVRGFSDTETLLVVRRETTTDARKLLRLRGIIERSMRSLYRIDPFQHHGHFVISDIDFDFYPQAFMPLVYLQFARAFLGGGSFRVVERDSHLERRRAVWDLCYYSRRRYLEHLTPRNFYEWKAHLCILLLVPSAYLAARGEFAPKRESFARAAGDFPAEAWHVIERVSALRTGWSAAMNPGLGALVPRMPSPVVRSFWPWFAGHAGGSPRDAAGLSGREGVRLAFVFSEATIGILRTGGIL